MIAPIAAVGLVLAQFGQVGQGVVVPDIAWSAISPELILFGIGILVLLLDTAGEARVRSSFTVFAIITGAAIYLWSASGDFGVPAMAIIGAAAQFGLTSVWRDRPRMLAAILTALGFAAAIGATAWQWAAQAGQLVAIDGGGALIGTQSLLANMVAADGVALFTRITVCITGLVTVPLGYAYLDSRRIHRGEYYPLLLFAATGMTLLGASADFIMVFISIEILSLALYIMSGFARRDLSSQESALKYFLLGAFSSALLLYGIALVYGIAGTTNIAAAGRALSSADAPFAMVLAALGLLTVGFGFKTALVPFHMWTPDVYQGAPTPITGFMAGATKAAAFAAFIRVFVGAFAPLAWSWVPVLSVVAVITMMAGAILAVVQTDLKRMLGYSAIAHAGYVLIGLVSVSRDGVSGTLFYLLVYAVMSLGAFGVLSVLERRTRKAMSLDDLRGLARRSPVPAVMLALFLLSLAGIPGTAGFTAKFAIFRAGVLAGQWPLVAVAVLSTVIAAFFYIRVIVKMFMDDEPAELALVPPALATVGATTGTAFAAAAVIVLGIVPGTVIELARQAATFAG